MQSTAHQQVITILLPEGEPNGLKIVQLAGWVGEALIIPRGKTSKLSERAETQQPGIYFLFGENETTDKPIVYVGQSGNVRNRLNQQATNNDYWNTAVVFVGGLEPGDVQHLEQRCFEIVKDIGRCDLRNNTSPPGGMLGEARQVAVNAYLQNIQFLISTLGFAIFQPIPKQNAAEIFYCRTEYGDAKGSLMESGEFIVYKDSIARQKENPSVREYTKVLRRQLVSEGILEQKDDNVLIFTRDHIFKTPSSASEVVKATPSSGWTSWVSKDGEALGSIKRQVRD